jgi:macrolide-specific efflux system membrane fusion protein
MQIGQSAEIVLEAYPAHKIPGKVDHIAYESKTVNNVTIYEVDLLPKKAPQFMRAGMTANITFIVKEKENVLILPEEAVRASGGQNVLVPSAGTNRRRNHQSKMVETGLSDGKKIEIVSGLAEGDAVIVPEIRLDAGGQRAGGGNPLSPFSGRRSSAGGGGRR